jgi:glutathione S-transferase
MIALLGRPTSINVRKVLWLCAELDLEVDLQPWGSGYRSTQLPAFLALNPNGLVPVLRDGDFTMWESNSICRYLAAREQRTDLLPTALRRRAQVEQWMDWQATELNNAWRYAFMALVRQDPAYTDKTAMQDSVASWNRCMGMLDAQLARTGAFVTGEKFTLADIVLGLSTCRWALAPIERPPFHAVAAWLGRLVPRPGYRQHAANGMP